MIVSVIDKLVGIVYEPIKLISDWAGQPLKAMEHERNLEEIKIRAEAESNEKMRQNSHALEIAKDIKSHEVDLSIKRKTEIQRILMEIEELKKDKEFDRMKAVSDAIIGYQEQLTRLNIEAINAIGHMQLDLRKKAQKLVYEHAKKYEKMQNKAHKKAIEELLIIEEKFSSPSHEQSRRILTDSVNRRLLNIIITAQHFLSELNNDIGVLNKSINLLTERGQEFIQEHLGHYDLVANGVLLESNGNKTPLLTNVQSN